MRVRSVIIILGLCLAAAPALWADSSDSIDSGSRQALERLERVAPESGLALREAAGVLVFPDVVKMGFGVGGQYGEGLLLVAGEPAGYYAITGGIFGLQLGAQTKSEVIVFRTDEALALFRGRRGWDVGVDGGIALPGDSGHSEAPVVGFIFSSQSLLGNLTFEGAKITRLAR